MTSKRLSSINTIISYGLMCFALSNIVGCSEGQVCSLNDPESCRLNPTVEHVGVNTEGLDESDTLIPQNVPDKYVDSLKALHMSFDLKGDYSAFESYYNFDEASVTLNNAPNTPISWERWKGPNNTFSNLSLKNDPLGSVEEHLKYINEINNLHDALVLTSYGNYQQDNDEGQVSIVITIEDEINDHRAGLGYRQTTTVDNTALIEPGYTGKVRFPYTAISVERGEFDLVGQKNVSTSTSTGAIPYLNLKKALNQPNYIVGRFQNIPQADTNIFRIRRITSDPTIEIRFLLTLNEASYSTERSILNFTGATGTTEIETAIKTLFTGFPTHAQPSITVSLTPATSTTPDTFTVTIGDTGSDYRMLQIYAATYKNGPPPNTDPIRTEIESFDQNGNVFHKIEYDTSAPEESSSILTLNLMKRVVAPSN